MRLREALLLVVVAGCAPSVAPHVAPASNALVGRAGAPAPSPSTRLKDAIAELRRVRPERLSDDEKKAKSAALDRAWQRLKADPDAGVAALAAEWDAIAAFGERDDYFAIDAAYLLFTIGGLREIARIEAMYRDVDLTVNFRLAFETLARLAATRDPRVLPVLRRALEIGRDTGEVFFPMHALRVSWPLTIDLIFAPYGRGLCAFASEELARSRSEAVLQSAAFLLRVNRCVEGLPVVRRLATSDAPNVATAGLRALGILGGPQDRELIERFAGDPRPDVRHACAFALYELGDPASTPVLRRLVNDPEPRVRTEAIAGVFHLIDADGARALLTHHRDTKLPDERKTISGFIEQLGQWVDMPVPALMEGDSAMWDRAIATYWRERDRFFDLKPGDRVLTRRELLDALARWEAAQTIEEKGWEWVEHRHVLSVAIPEDIPALLSVRGRLLERHSDEALEEVRIVDRLIQVLHRRRMGARKPNE